MKHHVATFVAILSAIVLPSSASAAEGTWKKLNYSVSYKTLLLHCEKFSKPWGAGML